MAEGAHPLAHDAGVRATRQAGDDVLLELGSGEYRFAYPSGPGARAALR